MSYADDLFLISRHAGSLSAATAMYVNFVALTGQELSAKSKYFCIDTPARMTINGCILPPQSSTSLLGIVLSAENGSFCVQVADKKVKDAVNILNRLAYSELPFDARVQVVSTLVAPMALAGTEAADVQHQEEVALRSSIVSAIWEKPGRKHSHGLVFTLFAKGHFTDPIQIHLYKRVLGIARMLAANDLFKSILQDSLVRLRRRRPNRAGGPCNAMLAFWNRFKVRLIQGAQIQIGNAVFDPCNPDDLKALPHALRSAARAQVWRTTETNCGRSFGDASGLAVGVNRPATLALYANASSPQVKGALRYILVGAFFAPKNEDRACTFCESIDADVEHVWWHCPQWQQLRDNICINVHAVLTLPKVMRVMGVVTLDCDRPRLVVLMQSVMVEIFMAVLAASGSSVPSTANKVPSDELRRAIRVCPVAGIS